MEEMISILSKSYLGNLASVMLAALWKATGQQWVMWLTIASLSLTIGYTLYKWQKDIRNDFKKKPVRSRKKLKP